ncbi:uncharacterized protein JCM10292_002464 [Rhodotorula paludigena]|uniref:uncharacterized protein n=1 Tax=Rhodotorula paludigena TaxID=86838 RepID=UPI00317C5912
MSARYAATLPLVSLARSSSSPLRRVSSRPTVKRTYGARKSTLASKAPSSPLTSHRLSAHHDSSTSASPSLRRSPRRAVPSSDWSDALAEASSSPVPLVMSGEPSSSGGRMGEARDSTPPTSPEVSLKVAGPVARAAEPGGTGGGRASASKGDLRSFFQRASPRKRRRLSPPPPDNEHDASASMARSTSTGSSSSAASASSARFALSSFTSRSSSSSSTSSASTSKPVKLEQLYLDPFHTAGHATLSCATCSLSYARTPEDLAYHDRHHKKVVGGCDWTTSDELKGVTVLEDAVEWSKGKRGAKVLMVDYPMADANLRRRLKDVLETIDTELSSTSLTPEQLALSKLFLFVTPQRKVVACAVIQRIAAAYEVVQKDSAQDEAPENKNDLLRFGEDDGAIFCSPAPLPTLLGVQRIWTSTSSRRHGLASLLLNHVADKFVYGSPIPAERRRTEFAFSQPTGMGQKLAKAWTGTAGFRVFVD